MRNILQYLFTGTVIIIFSIVNVYAQTSVNKLETDITNSKLSDNEKLQQLYMLKKNAEGKQKKDDSGYVNLLLTIANYESDKENYSAASSLALKSLQVIHNSSLKTLHVLTLRSYYNAATFFLFAKLYNDALPYYDTAIELSSENDPNDFLLNARYYRAYINDIFGDYEKVIDDSKLGFIEAKIRKDTSFCNRFMYFLSHSLMQQDKLDLATEIADEFMQVSANTSDSFHLASAYNIKGWIYKKQQNYLRAEELFRKALDIIPPSPDNYNAIAVFNNDLGALYAINLHNFKKAEACFRRVTKYGDMCMPEESYTKRFLVLCNSGDMYAISGMPQKAILTYGQALRCINIQLGDFLNKNPTLNQLKLVSNKENLLSVLSSKSDLLLKLYKTSNQKIYLQSCIQTSMLADSLITQMRHEQLGEKSKLYWRNETHKLFSVAMEACFSLGDINSAFYFMEKSRSVVLTDKLNELASHISYLTSAEANKETDLQRKTLLLEMRLSSMSPFSTHYTATEEMLLHTKEDLENYIKSLEKSNPRYYQYKYADDVPGLSDMKEYLKKNQQSYICYFVNDSAIYALGISKNSTRFIKIPAAELDMQQLSDFAQLCSNRQAVNSDYTSFAALSGNLYEKIFSPFSIPKGKVAICTDNFFIPFEALCSDKKGKQFLIKDYSISYVYSARSLLKPSYSSNKAQGNFAGFAPVSFANSLHVFSLMNSAKAMKEASQYYQNNTLFINRQSSRNNFLNNASKYAVVTIFSHAQADTTGKEPVLYMQDSLIQLSELQMLNHTATQFILLSACQTNAGKNATGEGIYSLARGFAAAGVPSVSATLWKADEEAIYTISARFNEYLANGMDKSEALRKAKLWYLQSSNREHALPYYWANLVLIGTSQPIVLAKPGIESIWIYTMSVLAFILLSIAFVLVYKRKSKFRI